MTMQSKKQFKNHSQTGYMQNNEPQSAGGEAGKKNRIQTHSQSGRSMVEMLGVLAIIAILSIGGIVGFRLAMNYYQANQIAHEMNIMRTDAQIKIAQGTEKLTLGDPYDSGNIQFNGYKTDFDCLDMETETSAPNKVVFCAVANAYYIELQEIPEGVCKPLANLIDNMDNEIAFYINDKSVDETEGEKGACNEEFNTLKVIFGADSDSEAIKCDTNTECESSENTPVCDKPRHVCVQCLTYNDCTDTPETPQCDTNTNTCKSCAEIAPEKPLWNGSNCEACPEDQPWNGESCGCKDNSLCFTTFGDHYYCHKTKKTDLIDGETGACKEINLPLYKKLSDGVEVWASTANIVNYWNTCRLCEARAGNDGSECSRNDYSSPNMVDLDFFQCANKEKIAQTFIDNTTFYCHKTSANVQTYIPDDIPSRVSEIGNLIGINLGTVWLADLAPQQDKVIRISPVGGKIGEISQCTLGYGHEEGGYHFPVCQ